MTQDADGKLTETQREVTVKVERQVRISRLLIIGLVLGAVAGMLLTTLFPVVVEGNYTLGEIVGFMAVVGAALGLLLAAAIALLLTRLSKRRKGTATAIQADVRYSAEDGGHT